MSFPSYQTSLSPHAILPSSNAGHQALVFGQNCYDGGKMYKEHSFTVKS